jgi:DNA-binding phage protein
MPLTREFRETIGRELREDRAFRIAYLNEAIDCLHGGDLATGKSMLRDFINGTLGFTELGRKVQIPPKSLMRMLSASGNPHADRLFAILGLLQRRERVRVRLVPAARGRVGRLAGRSGLSR